MVFVEYVRINVKRKRESDFVSGLGLYLDSIAFLYYFLCRECSRVF